MSSKPPIYLLLMVFAIPSLLWSQALSIPELSAIEFCDEMLDHSVHVTYCYEDGNSQSNEMIPTVEGDTTIEITQQWLQNPESGRSCGKLTFRFKNPESYTNWRYTYGLNNYGQYIGRYIGKATKLIIHARGEGTVEFMLGGTNRTPFHNSDFPYQDGFEVRSTGLIDLTPEWREYEIDLSDNRFWIYKSPKAGLENRFPVWGKFEDAYDCSEYLHVSLDSMDSSGEDGIAVTWYRPDSIISSSTCYGGFGLLSPNINPATDWSLYSAQGYDLPSLEAICFRAKMTKPGRIEVNFNSNQNPGYKRQANFWIDTVWQEYTFPLPTTIAFSRTNLGFGIALIPEQSGQLFTPDSITLFLDSIYYKGVQLQSNDSIITGVGIIASKANNTQDSTTVFFDNIHYDHADYELARFAQSFLVHNDTLIDKTQQQAAHVYDNALLLITYLGLYRRTCDERYLEYARHIGNAFIFAMLHDRFYTDKRLRNVYKSGLVMSYNDTIRHAGWWDELEATFYEDRYFVSTSTGNMAYAGLALTSLFEISKEQIYLDAAKDIANWCIQNTWSTVGPGGFTGGIEGFQGAQAKATWKSSEHNLDLRALFIRLYRITNEIEYKTAADHAHAFVLSMWNDEDKHFWTGTIADGMTISEDHNRIPLDVQPWFIMAFADWPEVSSYYACLDWAKENCYKPDFDIFGSQLPAFDFNSDLDGAWMEGTAQMALAYKMIGKTAAADSLLATIEYVQVNADFNNGQGIIAASIDHLTTGFNWEYHRRLALGSTCWYLLAALGVNPYFVPESSFTIDVQDGEISCASPITMLQANSNFTEVTYDWTGPYNFSATGDSIWVSAPGLYTLIATDAIYGCTTTEHTMVHLTDSSFPEINIEGNLIIPCAGETTTLVVQSTLPNVSFTWEGDHITDSTNTQQNLPAGAYTIHAMTPTGCKSSTSLIIEEIPKLTANWSAITACDGSNDISIAVNGGTPPYHSSIHPPSPLPPVTSFQVLTIDANNCMDSISGLTDSFFPLTAQISHTDETAPGANDGTAAIVWENGVPPFTVLWNTGETTDSIENLAPGTYIATVTDSTLCMVSDSTVVLGEIIDQIKELSPFKSLNLRPNPSNGVAYLDVALHQAARVKIELTDIAGKLIHRIKERRVLSKSFLLDVDKLPAGSYMVRVWIEEKIYIRPLVIINNGQL
ncbi:MAG: T9SS type A sorting domain-containing protein [Bacteroidota bacterium]